ESFSSSKKAQTATMKTTLTLTCAVLLLSICQGAIRREAGSCEKMMMDAAEGVAKEEGKTICQYNKDVLNAYRPVLSTCQDPSTPLTQEWLMSGILDIELAEKQEANCDVDTTVLYPFLTTENKAEIVEAVQHLTDIPSAMLTCLHDPMIQSEKNIITVLREKKGSACMAGLAAWSSMPYNVVKCTKTAGATVSCDDERRLYQFGALNIHLYTQLIADFPEMCKM
ncbi:unnamed protein product, partial [Owenia fusiformis]